MQSLGISRRTITQYQRPAVGKEWYIRMQDLLSHCARLPPSSVCEYALKRSYSGDKIDSPWAKTGGRVLCGFCFVLRRKDRWSFFFLCPRSQPFSLPAGHVLGIENKTCLVWMRYMEEGEKHKICTYVSVEGCTTRRSLIVCSDPSTNRHELLHTFCYRGTTIRLVRWSCWLHYVHMDVHTRFPSISHRNSHPSPPSPFWILPLSPPPPRVSLFILVFLC